MFSQKHFFGVISFFFACSIVTNAQPTKRYNLSKLAKKHKLEMTASYPQMQSIDNASHGVTLRGIAWLKDVSFETGTIDVDLRGRNVFLHSFMGIAFHAKDTISYDVVYFCPFRFHDTLAETRKYSVKYMSFPDFMYTKLRKDQPGLYENEVASPPAADEWFHVTIDVGKDSIAIYINHSRTPSLKAKKLPTLSSGKIGLWSYSETLSSDFANLAIMTNRK